MLSSRIVNASPIIYLHHVDLLEELNEHGLTVVVLVELGGLGPDDPAAKTRPSPQSGFLQARLENLRRADDAPRR